MGYILTGKLVEDGIDNAVVTSVVLKSQSLPVDSYVIYRVGDEAEKETYGVAVRQKWYPNI